MSYQDDETDIRIPDSTHQEQLLDDDRSQYQREIDEALNQSMKEMIDYNIKSTDYERQIIEEYNTETKKRISLLEPILFEINKVSKFDKDIKELNQIIKPIIDSYCNMLIDHYEFDELTYNSIFKQISSLRISKLNINVLESILVIKDKI